MRKFIVKKPTETKLDLSDGLKELECKGNWDTAENLYNWWINL